MLNKRTSPAKKEVLVASMAKKLAGESTIELLGKKRRKKPLLIYIIAIISLTALSLPVLIFNRSQKELKENIAPPVAKNITPLQLLTDAFNKDSISADEYALHLRDLLVRYDSLPVKYRTERPAIRSTDVYSSIVNIWTKLGNKTRIILIKDFPDLNPRIERMKDSLGIR